MKALAIVGLSDSPNKVVWLRERGVDFIRGAQIVMFPNDMLSQNLINYSEKILKFLDETTGLERISIMILCWPHVKRKDDQGNVTDVAMVTPIDADHFSYVIGVCQALEQVHKQTGVAVDISYHPLMTWPYTIAKEYDRLRCIGMQNILWRHELNLRECLADFLELFEIHHVGINIENEPPMSDENGNLFQIGNRLFTEQICELPQGWGVTADIQHCNMMLEILTNPEFRHYTLRFPPLSPGCLWPEKWAWEAQFDSLRQVKGSITFHLSQMDDPLRHTGSAIRFDDPIMDWPIILRLLKELDEYRNGDVWWAIEAGAFPNYESDREAFLHVQKVLES